MPHQYKCLETHLIHSGEAEPRIEGAVVTPIFQSSTYEYGGQADYHDLRYIRLNTTPNHVVLHKKLAALENAEAGLVAASGMAAISATLLTVLSTGDHFLAQRCLYGGTRDFIDEGLPRLGITSTPIEADKPETWEATLRPETKAVFVETMSNPLLEIADAEAVVAFAKRHNLVSIIDNTFATPVNFRPCERGFDLCLHSCTKYLNGHSDIVAGAVAGGAQRVEAVRHMLNHLGGSLDPHACFLLERGMKTLAVRMRHQNESALAIARFLESHAAVAKVVYPGLESHAQHALAARLFAGYGGMLSFELHGGAEAADRLLARLRLPMSAPSLGGVESLITRPATTSHVGVSPEVRREQGISDGLIRFSIGLEGTEDLIDDLDGALAT